MLVHIVHRMIVAPFRVEIESIHITDDDHFRITLLDGTIELYIAFGVMVALLLYILLIIFISYLYQIHTERLGMPVGRTHSPVFRSNIPIGIFNGIQCILYVPLYAIVWRKTSMPYPYIRDIHGS